MMLKTLIELEVAREGVLYPITISFYQCQQASILVLQCTLQKNQIPGLGSVHHVALLKHTCKALPADVYKEACRVWIQIVTI